MTRLRRRNAAIVGLVVVVVTACALGALATASIGSEPEATTVEQLAATPTGPGRFARAYGLNPAEGTVAFSLGNGQSVSVVGDTSGECLIRSGVGGTSEGCDALAAVNEGKGIWVADECGSSGQNRMEITGLAPEGASSVRLDSSNGGHEETTVVDGAFRFEGTNPDAGAPYPAGVEWVASNGHPSGEASLPVNGDEFCSPTS